MAMTLEELEEFVDSLFIMNYMSEDNRDSVRYHTRENKTYNVIDKIESLEKSYLYSKRQEYLLRVDVMKSNDNLDRASVRFITMGDMKSMTSSVTTDEVKLSCGLMRINCNFQNSERIVVNAHGTRESCKEYVSWIITQMEKYKYDKSNLTYGRSY